MSTVALSYVWKHCRYKGGAKVVLLALADNANDEGVAWPSVETLSEKAELTRRQTQRILDRLEADGVLIIYNRVMEGKPTQHFSNVYVICMEGVDAKLPELSGELRQRVVTQKPSGVVTSASLGSDMDVTRGSDIGVTGVVTSASLEPSVEPSVTEPSDNQKENTARIPTREDAPARVAQAPPDLTPEQQEANRLKIAALIGTVADRVTYKPPDTKARNDEFIRQRRAGHEQPSQS